METHLHRRLHDYASKQILNQSIHGIKIPFIKPAGFDESYAKLVNIVFSGGAGRGFYPVFLTGASGGGKTRMGAELYLQVKRDQKRLALDDLAYMCVNMGTLQKTQGDDIAPFFARVLADYALAINRDDPLGSQPTFKALVDSIFPDKEKKAALFIQLDEFQKRERESEAIICAVTAYNERNSRRPILLVGSGLYADLARLGLTASSERHKLEVRFLDAAKRYALVRAAAKTVCTEMTSRAPAVDMHYLEAALPEAREDAPLAVQHLVDDTSGWALACVQLGVEMCLVSDTVAEGLMTSKQDPTLLAEVERAVTLRLADKYQWDAKDAIRDLTSAGFNKLLFLAMSPISVSVVCAWCDCAFARDAC